MNRKRSCIQNFYREPQQNYNSTYATAAIPYDHRSSYQNIDPCFGVSFDQIHTNGRGTFILTTDDSGLTNVYEKTPICQSTPYGRKVSQCLADNSSAISNTVRSLNSDDGYFHNRDSKELEQTIRDIEILYSVNIPEAITFHESLIHEKEAALEGFAEEDNLKSVKNATLQELFEQYESFKQRISYLRSMDLTSLREAKEVLRRIKIEVQRLKAGLPIYAWRERLINTIRSNRVVILKADTGSGKSSQLVQYLLDAGFGSHGQIVCSQPRRLAVRELASRVAQELGCRVGDEVGCRIGASHPKFSCRTVINFVTDAVLLNEYQADRLLKRYALIIIDEAHERRVDTDLLFGAMKLCLKERPDIRLIIMSATLNEKLLCNYYEGACLLEIPGRAFPIDDEYAMEDPENYVDEAINKTLEIHAKEAPGDILVFLTGQDEIDKAVDMVTSKIPSTKPALVLPLHGKLSDDETQLVFQPLNGNYVRKIVFATNVAETSITIQGIRYVIDSGMAKEVMWDSKRRMRVLKTDYTTQSSIKQRRGRAGRTSAGICYHLYTYDTYQALDVCSRAEILCTQPSTAVLKLKYLQIVDDIKKFEWLEAPLESSLEETVKNLMWLGAIDRGNGRLTSMGRRMAKIGLEPSISTMILTAEKRGCLSHVLALAGMLSIVQNIWWRSRDEQSKQMSDEIRGSFMRDTDIGGDYIVLLRIFLEWYNLAKNREARRAWCIKHMIRGKSMHMASTFIHELIYQIDRHFRLNLTELTEPLIQEIIGCICAGFFQNLAISNGPVRAGYKIATSVTNTVARIHRSSTMLFMQKPPKFVLFHEVLNINQTNFLSVLCPVELDQLNSHWLQSLPSSPSQSTLESYTFFSLGPILFRAIVGKRFEEVSNLEETLDVMFEIESSQSKLTIWGRQHVLGPAQEHIQKIIDYEREKLLNEVKEFDIVGSTRILLGPGAQPRLVLIDAEYVRILIKNLPKYVTVEQIRNKCEQYGKVRSVIRIGADQHIPRYMVNFMNYPDAQKAVTHISGEMWNESVLYAQPSYSRKSLETNQQNYQIKAQWFLTESERSGRIIFSERDDVLQAYKLFTRQYNFPCQIELDSVTPVVKCTWPMTPHSGQAIVNFATTEEAQQVLDAQYECQFRVFPGRRSNTSIYLRNIPRDFDEVKLQNIFPNSTKIFLLRVRRGLIAETPIGMEDAVRDLFAAYKSFVPVSVLVEPQLHHGYVVAYAQFTDEIEMKKAINDYNNEIVRIGSNTVKIKLEEQRKPNPSTRRTEIKADQYRLKFSSLPQNINEYFLKKALEARKLSTSMIHAIIYRQKLADSNLLDRSKLSIEIENGATELKNLFTSRGILRSEPDIQIRQPTEDGRVTAYIHFDDPRDFINAVNIWNSLNETDISILQLKQINCVPIIVHKIIVNEMLAKTIGHKLDQTVNLIKRDSSFFDVELFKKTIVRDDKSSLLISIRGNNLKQLYKARIIFDDVLKGVCFQLHDPTWATVLFDSVGKQFLSDLQSKSGTYIWWSWKSTHLRIFGEDQACQNVYKEIDSFVEAGLARRSHSVNVHIPEDCVRECFKNLSTFRDLNNHVTSVVVNIAKRIISVTGDQTSTNECAQQVKEILDKFRSTNQSTDSFLNKRIFDTDNICTICCSNFDKPHKLQNCGHQFCKMCLDNHFYSYFNVTLNINTFKITCPSYKCDQICLISDIITVLGYERMVRLAALAFQIYVRSIENDLVHCIGIDCNQVYRPSDSSEMYYCDQCVKVYCIPCKAEYHTGMACEQYKQLYEEKDEQTILSYNLGKLPYKTCPKCNTPIDKYTGCNAVCCTLCGVHFCWLCRAADDIDIHSHFTNEESPCFNRMLDANRNGEDPNL